MSAQRMPVPGRPCLVEDVTKHTMQDPSNIQGYIHPGSVLRGQAIFVVASLESRRNTVAARERECKGDPVQRQEIMKGEKLGRVPPYRIPSTTNNGHGRCFSDEQTSHQSSRLRAVTLGSGQKLRGLLFRTITRTRIRRNTVFAVVSCASRSHMDLPVGF